MDVISTGDHAIKVQDNSALVLLGTDAVIDFKDFSGMMPRWDAGTPILAGLTSDRDLLAQLTESDSTQAKPLSEYQAKQMVKDADKEYVWAQDEAKRIANGAKPTNPFVDLAYILSGGTTYDTRVNLGDVAAQAGDNKGAVAAYEDALSNFMSSPFNIVTGGDNLKADPPEDLVDKLKDLGVSKEQALADIARKEAAGEPRR